MPPSSEATSKATRSTTSGSSPSTAMRFVPSCAHVIKPTSLAVIAEEVHPPRQQYGRSGGHIIAIRSLAVVDSDRSSEGSWPRLNLTTGHAARPARRRSLSADSIRPIVLSRGRDLRRRHPPWQQRHPLSARHSDLSGLSLGGTGIELGAADPKTCDAALACRLSHELRSLSRSVWFRLDPCRGGFRGNQVATSGTESPRTAGIIVGVRPRDTSPDSHQAQLRAYRRLGPAGRARVAGKLSADTRELTRAGIRARHPEYGDEEVESALRRILLGDELFCRAWPALPLLPP